MATKFRQGQEVLLHCPMYLFLHKKNGVIVSHDPSTNLYRAKVAGLTYRFREDEMSPVDNEIEKEYDKTMNNEDVYQTVKDTLNDRIAELDEELEALSKKQTELTNQRLRLNGTLRAIILMEQEEG